MNKYRANKRMETVMRTGCGVTGNAYQRPDAS
jgi:hypothetical protein